MNVSSSQLPLTLPERRGTLPGARAPVAQAVAPAVQRSSGSDVQATPAQIVGDLERLGRYSLPNRGGLLLYAVTGSDRASAAGVRVDVRI